MKFDFVGYATKNDMKCSDGRIIRRDAFIKNDGEVIPLVWNHEHNDPSNILGKAYLANVEDGVLAGCVFNNTKKAREAREAVRHGDITYMSIFANHLKHEGNSVVHGDIKEVSLVISGANPGAKILNTTVVHSDGSEWFDDEEATIYTGVPIELGEELSHSDDEYEEDNDMNEEFDYEEAIDSMTDEQKEAVVGIVSTIIDSIADDDDDDDDDYDDNDYDDDDDDDYLEQSDIGGGYMRYNVFEDYDDDDVLMHSEDYAELANDCFSDIQKYGSLKESVLAHTATYGIDNIEWLFPDVRELNTPPALIKEKEDWATLFLDKATHVPFSRIRMTFADITKEEARARGYVKGNLKVDEVISLARREVFPTTVYKKQRIDRDDWHDITSFDIAVWIKAEMRGRLNVEIARAAMFSDGRPAGNDKINETCIIPIWKDSTLFTIVSDITVTPTTTRDQKTDMLIDAAVMAHDDFEGSGTPYAFVAPGTLSAALLQKDSTGRRIYKDKSELATALLVKDIIPVPIMKNLTRTVNGTTKKLEMLIVNPADYKFGADKGGNVGFFEDFDIDYNQQKYLIETRCSGALAVAHSAIVIESVTSAQSSGGNSSNVSG